MATLKTCFKCLQSKALPEFYRHAQMGDGHLNKCIVCTKKDVAMHRLANLETIRSYDRMRAGMPHRIAAAKVIQTKWRLDHPDRKHAHNKLRRAVQTGVVIPWPVCAVPECGCKPEAHHPDYSRPLDVVWLCSSHHKQAHALAA